MRRGRAPTEAAPASDCNNDEPFRTIKQVADRWDVSEKTIQRLIRAGKLWRARIGRQVRLRGADIYNYEKQQRHQCSPLS